MPIETVLLVVESILLLATIILLLYSLKEGRGRKALLLEVGRAIKILTRQEYFLVVTDSMMDAKVEVIGSITGRVPLSDDKKRTRDVINNIERLTRNEVRVKYLLPKFPDRLHIGYLYTKAGAEIRYSDCPIVHDIRYMVVDDRLVVIGIPEITGEQEATRKGYRIPSEGLATMLKEYFNRCWEKSISYEEYVKEVMKQTGATPKLLAREFQIDEKEMERLAG
ncbi:MAG: hypothetical protein AB1606_01370 [Nitrospirota bacterium]